MPNSRETPAGAGRPAAGHTAAMSAYEWALLLTLGLIWGGSFYFNKILLGAMEPITIMLGRAGIAAAALLLFMQFSGHRVRFGGGMWRVFLVMSVFNNIIPFLLILWGQKHIGIGLAAILNGTTPFFAAMFGWALGSERIVPHRVAGVLIGIAGMVLMIGPDVVAAGLGNDVLAQFAVLGAAMGYAFAAIYGRRYARLGISAPVAAAGQLAVTTLIAIPLVLLIDRPWTMPMPGLEHWITLAALSLVSTAFAYIIFFRLLSGTGAVNTSLVTLLVPVSALMLGTLVLGEAFTLRQAVGMAIILFGIVVTDGRVLSVFRR